MGLWELPRAHLVQMTPNNITRNPQRKCSLLTDDDRPAYHPAMPRSAPDDVRVPGLLRACPGQRCLRSVGGMAAFDGLVVSMPFFSLAGAVLFSPPSESSTAAMIQTHHRHRMDVVR